MSCTDPVARSSQPPAARRERWAPRISRVSGFLNVCGLGWFVPLLRIAAGERVKPQLLELWRSLGIPLAAILLFLAVWGFLAPRCIPASARCRGRSRSGSRPTICGRNISPNARKKQAFYERQKKRNAEIARRESESRSRKISYTGQPTYLDQIVTSLKTVFTGFILATLVAVPLGILCGLSQTVTAALNPLIQIFKPVSPLAWLPIVTHGGERALCHRRSDVCRSRS